MTIRAFAVAAVLPIFLLGGASVSGCSDDDTSSGTVDPLAHAPEALENYAANLEQAYKDSVTDANTFSAQIDSFLAAPTEGGLSQTRTAWLESRAHYMLTEGARFYDGPIDIDPPNHEAALNSWPLDEAYIDYTTNKDTSVVDETTGFINNPTTLADITVDALDSLNAQGGDENISNGYHAIEFLLWGQALSEVGPGSRPASDYDLKGTRKNPDRRAKYLQTAAKSVIAHLTDVASKWTPDAEFRKSFVGGKGLSVALALTGLGKFSKGELAGERINAAYTSKDRRDQHDCFSSATLTDYARDATGIQNLYLGNYNGKDGFGLDELVKVANADLDTRLKAQIQASIDAIKAIPAPFEQAIQGEDTAPGRVAIQAAVNSLRKQGDMFAEAASALGLSITVPDSND